MVTLLTLTALDWMKYTEIDVAFTFQIEAAPATRVPWPATATSLPPLRLQRWPVHVAMDYRPTDAIPDALLNNSRP
jgi:hypothetical protein